MLYILIGIAGIVIGILIGTALVLASCYSGTFFVNETNPEKDIYRLDFDNLNEVAKKDWILFKVKHDS